LLDFQADLDAFNDALPRPGMAYNQQKATGKITSMQDLSTIITKGASQRILPMLNLGGIK